MKPSSHLAAPILATTIGVLGLAGCAKAPEPPPPAAATVSTHARASLRWESDWERAMERARAENKVVLVEFSADWCIWCKRLDATTFADADVARVLNERVVPLRLIIDGDGRERARALGVDAPPTLVFVSPDAREIGRILGYLPPTRFLDRVTTILAPA